MRVYGIAVPLGLAFADGIARGALDAAMRMPGVRLRILRDHLEGRRLAEWASWAAPDGLIHFATAAVTVPSVTVCRRGPASVTVDEAAIGRLAADHLRAQSPGSLAVVDVGSEWSQGRADAFVAAAPGAVRIRERAWDVPAGRRRLASLLGGMRRPVGCFAGNDRTAAALADALAVAGLEVGRDVLLIGADDDALACRSALPALSSVALPWESVGRAAMLMLHRRAWRMLVVPPIGVVPRGSSDRLAADDPALAAAVAAARTGVDGVDALARAAGLGRRSLERRCREALGLSPLDLLHRARLDRARMLLLDGAPVETVARSCGWSGRAAFAAAFRAAAGETPGAWRVARLGRG